MRFENSTGVVTIEKFTKIQCMVVFTDRFGSWQTYNTYLDGSIKSAKKKRARRLVSGTTIQSLINDIK